MVDIWFYDFGFNLLHVENHFISSNWSICYNDIGTFEAHFDLQSDAIRKIMDNEYLVAVQGNNAAIITSKTAGADFAIFGRTCNWLLTRRVTGAFKMESGTVYSLVTSKILEAFNDSPFLIGSGVGLTTAITPQNPIERADKCETFSLVQECLAQENLGHEVIFDIIQKKWKFQVLIGNKKNRLVISAANRNAYDVVMDSNSLNFFTEGWYQRKMEDMGEWNPSTNKVTVNGTLVTLTNSGAANYGKYWKVSADYTDTRFNITGFKKGSFLVCRELDMNGTGVMENTDNSDHFWVKIESQSKSGIYRWETILSGETESEAVSTLSKAERTNTVQGKTAMVYLGREYSLGDIVNVEWQVGQYKRRTRRRIVGVNLWYESGNVGEEPIFENVEAKTE